MRPPHINIPKIIKNIIARAFAFDFVVVLVVFVADVKWWVSENKISKRYFDLAQYF